MKAVRAVRERFARLGALLLAAGVAGLGLYGIRFDSALPERLPSPLDWRAAAARLARDGQPGDVVALAPWWAERARQALPASLPVLAFPLLAGEDLVGVRRVWLIALPAAPGFRRDVEEDLALRASAVEGPLRLGGLEVTRVDLRAPALPIAFLPDRLDSADVRSGADPCAAGLGGGFRCPGGAAVGREVREVDLLPRPCVFGKTSADASRPISIAFPGVRLGSSLRGHAGVVGEAALVGDGPLRVEVSIDGRDAAGVDLAPGDAAWRPFTTDTSSQAGRTATVTFTVSDAASEPRPFCLDAYALP